MDRGYTLGTRFSLGRILTTRGIAEQFDSLEVGALLTRHMNGDWGNLSNNDMKLNEIALTENDRVFSAYETPKGKVWVITEYDRSATTVMLSDEY
jgi:hypothetical protein